MHFTVKVRKTGEILHIKDDDALKTIGDVYKFIENKNSSRNEKLFLGEKRLSDASQTISDAGIVNGDRLFLYAENDDQTGANKCDSKARKSEEPLEVDAHVSRQSKNAESEGRSMSSKLAKQSDKHSENSKTAPFPDVNPFAPEPEPLNPLLDPRHPNYTDPDRQGPQMPDAPFGEHRGELMQPPKMPGRHPGDPFSRGGGGFN